MYRSGSLRLAGLGCLVALAAGFLLSVPAQAGPGDLSQAKIGLHAIQGFICDKAPLSCFCNLPEVQSIGCDPGGENLTVHGDVFTVSHVYILALDIDPELGFRSASVGIDYDPPGAGVDVFGWRSCVDEEIPEGQWPMPGTSNTISFLDCRGTTSDPLDGDGKASVVLGSFYAYAYGDGTLEVRPWDDVDGEAPSFFGVTDCSGDPSLLTFPEHAGVVGFGGAAGYNPCDSGFIPVTPSTWGTIKNLYRRRE